MSPSAWCVVPTPLQCQEAPVAMGPLWSLLLLYSQASGKQLSSAGWQAPLHAEQGCLCIPLEVQALSGLLASKLAVALALYLQVVTRAIVLFAFFSRTV